MTGLKKLFIACACFCIVVPIFAHTPLWIIEDSDDQFVYVKAGFSNGQDAAGMPLYVKSKFDNGIIEKLTFPESSQLAIKIPEEPYFLMFDGGPGHKVAKNGPAGENGFTVHPEAAQNKIPGQGMPLWLIILIIAAILTAGVFIKQRFSQNSEKN